VDRKPIVVVHEWIPCSHRGPKISEC
jgi:hypothetical protein